MWRRLFSVAQRRRARYNAGHIHALGVITVDFSSLIVAFQAVVPVFVFTGIGMFIRRRKMLSDTELKRVNAMVFNVFFFFMLFNAMYRMSFGEAFQPRLIVFAMGSLAVVYALAFAGTCWFEPSNRRRGAVIQGIFRSNFVLMGIPLAGNLFGDDNIAVTTMMIAFMVPTYNALGVITLEIFRGAGLSNINAGHLVLDVFKNPMIRGALLGVAFNLSGLELPATLMRPVGQIGAACTPLALIVLGASFKLGSISAHKAQLLTVIASRLIAIPGVVLALAAWLGFRGVEFATLISIFATPCAVAGFIMAQQMDSDAELAGNCVVFTTACSALTIFAWIVLYRELGCL